MNPVGGSYIYRVLCPHHQSVRGDGGNLGVVTLVMAGVLAWPAAQTSTVLDMFREVTASAPAELTAAVIMRKRSTRTLAASSGTRISHHRAARVPQRPARPGRARSAAHQVARPAWQAIQPHSTGGSYINFQTEDETADRTHDSYRHTYRRLAAVKATYDPGNLFRVNRNIEPLR